MYEADRLTIERGTPGEVLMENAGKALADNVAARFPEPRVHVLCGPGNNGGDGFAAARHLAGQGRDVALYLMGEINRLSGDAAIHAARWQDETGATPGALTDCHPQGGDVVIDCLFGAGLQRDIEGDIRAVLERCTVAHVVACDLPSGINGDNGAVMGYAPEADVTVTFGRPKYGHLLMPGRQHCGELVVADIGIPDSVIDDLGIRTYQNDPSLWSALLPTPGMDAHKFARGHLQIVGGAEMTGAARLSAWAARRAGAGLATILSPASAVDVYRAGDPGTMVEVLETGDDLSQLLSDDRRNAVVVGPGNGLNDRTRDLVLAALASGRPTVLDADALSVFKEDVDTLIGHIAGPVVMTPHEGEFARLFDMAGDKLTRARQAADACGAVVLLKGPDTVIAEPSDSDKKGRAAINTSGTPLLATAGSGDVLAGLIGALMAQGMPTFEAACAGAWLHGRAGERVGFGLIAEDLPEAVSAEISAVLSPI